MTLNHTHSELDRRGMWPQPEILPGDQRSHPPLACPNSAVSVIYCQLDRDDRLDLSPGNEQLDWWHGFCLKTQAVLKRYGAVTAERDSWGFCCALGLGASADKALRDGLKAVQCALQLMSCIGQLELPGGASVRAKIGMHSGEASDSLVECSDTLHYRLCGPAYNVARQLAGSASWGGMLVSEEVWKEQGNYGRLWVYNQGVSMSWGRVISCFALSPEGHGAYLHSNALPTRKTCSIGMPTMPCHSTAWQVEASVGGGTARKAPQQVVQSVRFQPLHGEPLKPFATKAASAVPAASYQMGAGDSRSSQLYQVSMRPQPALTAPDVSSPPGSVASSVYSMQLPGHAQSEDHRRHFDEWLTQRSPAAQQAPSSTWGTDSAEAFPEFVHADVLGLSPGSRHLGSPTTVEESLDSASALQPHAATFAQMLQLQNEHAARSRAAEGSAGSSGIAGRLSASQMAHALSALPRLSDTERMARFMAALQELRPRGALAPAADLDAPELSHSQPEHLLQELSQLWSTQKNQELVNAASPPSSFSGSSQGLSSGGSGPNMRSSARQGSSRHTPPSADAALPTLGANPCPHPWPEHFIVEGNWFSQQQQQHRQRQQPKPGQGPDVHPGTSIAPLGTGWGPDRNPWPQNWGNGKPGIVPELSAPAPTIGKEALQGPDVQPQTWIGVTQSGAMTGSATIDLAAGPAGHWAQHEQSFVPVCPSELGDVRRTNAREHSAQPAGRSMGSTQSSVGGETPQAPVSTAPAVITWDQAGAFEAYWDHVKTYSSNVPSGTCSMFWDHVKATNGMPQSGTHSKAFAQKLPFIGLNPTVSATQQSLQHVQPLTQQQRQMSRIAASTQPQDASPPDSSAPSELHLELAQRQSSHSSAQSQREKVAWPQQLPSVALPPLQAYEPEQVAQAQSTAGAPLGAMTAAQQLSAHDGFRRKWAPGGPLHVTWQEDPSYVPERMSSSATSLASYRSAARSMLSGAAAVVFPPTAGAQLPCSVQQLPAASMTAPSVPAPSTYPAPSSAAATPASSVAQAPRPQRPPGDGDRDLGRTRVDLAERSPVSRSLNQTDPPPTVWLRLAAAFRAQLLGNPGTVTSLRLSSGKAVHQSATLEFLNPRLERCFQSSWATRKVAQDKAVLIFFTLLVLSIEIADIAFGHAPQARHILPGLGAAALMGAMLAASVLRPAWYISHRAGLQLLLRILRAVSLNWQVKQAALALRAASGTYWPARTFLDTIVRSGFPLAVLSLCDGNTMGPHMVGDLVCVLLAAAQAPWLCSAPCSLELVASSAAWLAARAAMLVVLCSAALFSTEEASRRAFIEAVDACATPVLARPRASAGPLNPARLYLSSSGSVRCGRHAADAPS